MVRHVHVVPVYHMCYIWPAQCLGIFFYQNYWEFLLHARLYIMGRVFFSRFLMGGTQNFRSPSVPDGDEVGRGKDLRKKSD